MDLEFKRKEKVVGFFLLTICLLVFIAFTFLGRAKGWFKDYVEYYTILNETYNLQNGAPVKLYNAQIGKIKKIELVEDKVRVTLLIVEDYANRIRTSSYVTVQSPTFIGSEYLALITNDKTSPMILERDQIPAVEKKSLSDIMAQFQVEETAKKFVTAVQELSDMAHKLNSPDGPVFSVLNDIETIVSDIEKGKGNVGEVLRTTKLADEVHERFEQLEKILEDFRTAVSKTPRTVDLVNKNLERIDKIGANIELGSEDLVILVKDLKKRVNEIEVIIENIEKGSRHVPVITETAVEGIQEIRRGVKKADDAIEALQKSFLIRNPSYLYGAQRLRHIWVLWAPLLSISTHSL